MLSSYMKHLQKQLQLKMLPFTLSAELSVLWLLHLGARISSWPVS